jgi:hypothetical protein
MPFAITEIEFRCKDRDFFYIAFRLQFMGAFQIVAKCINFAKELKQ